MLMVSVVTTYVAGNPCTRMCMVCGASCTAMRSSRPSMRKPSTKCSCVVPSGTMSKVAQHVGDLLRCRGTFFRMSRVLCGTLMTAGCGEWSCNPISPRRPRAPITSTRSQSSNLASRTVESLRSKPDISRCSSFLVPARGVRTGILTRYQKVRCVQTAGCTTSS